MSQSKSRRPLTQKKKRTLTMESAIVVLTYYTDVSPGQRELLAHFRGTEHKITQPKLTALLNGNGFKDWETDLRFIAARRRAREKADRQNTRIDKAMRSPDASDDVLTFNANSPESVFAAKQRLDEVWCRFAPSVRELATVQAAIA